MAQEFDIIQANLLPAASSVSDNDMLLVVQGGRLKRVPPSLMKGKKGDPGDSAFLGVTATYIQWKQGASGSWNNLLEIERLRGPKGEKPIFRKINGCLMMKYEGQPDSAFVNIFDREELKMKFADLTPAEVNLLKLHFADLTEADKAELMKPATDAAARADEKLIQISQDVNLAIADTEEARDRASTSAENADQARIVLSENVEQKLQEVDNMLLTIQDGKTTQFEIGTVETSGSTSSASLTDNGTDVSGNPKKQLNLIIQKGDKGEKGNTMYATFGFDPSTGELVMYTDEEYTGPNFELNNGELSVII